MADKMLIFGGNGWLGRKFGSYFSKAVLSDVDAANPLKVVSELERFKPDVVINAAGKTGGKPDDPPENIDWCETHRWETYYSNVIASCVLAKTCSERGIYFVHLSSGCIFDGPSPHSGGWTENDKPNPVSYYAKTKAEADRHILSICDAALLLRIRMPIDKQPSPRNTITKIAGYSSVIDAPNSVTVVPDLLFVARRLISKRKRGIYNVVNPGSVRHTDILADYKDLVDPSHSCEFLTPEQFYERKVTIARRSNCILSTAKLRSEGIVLLDAMTCIMMCLEEYKMFLDHKKTQ